MKTIRQKYGWIFSTLLGSLIFALGFDLFLVPNDLNPGGISGLSVIIVEVLGFGSVGTLSILINLPLFALGGIKIGKRFFIGSLIGMVSSSVLIDLLVLLPAPQSEPLLGALYGGVVCGAGLGMVFVAGTSTGGSDILVRLLKLRFRDLGGRSRLQKGVVVVDIEDFKQGGFFTAQLNFACLAVQLNFSNQGLSGTRCFIKNPVNLIPGFD